ncbi:MAG: hypothetical protein GY774_05545 [Planctomycetes bacterium]|nr:hypothetical protein [Planctomycetota bacterium]
MRKAHNTTLRHCIILLDDILRIDDSTSVFIEIENSRLIFHFRLTTELTSRGKRQPFPGLSEALG